MMALPHPVTELLGQPLVNARKLSAMDHSSARQPGQAILGLLLEQRAQCDDAVTARRRLPARLLTHRQQIVLNHRAREQRRCDPRQLLQSLVGKPLHTITGRPNRILSVGPDSVRVWTTRSLEHR